MKSLICHPVSVTVNPDSIHGHMQDVSLSQSYYKTIQTLMLYVQSSCIVGRYKTLQVGSALSH